MKYLFIAEKADVMNKVSAVYKKYEAEIIKRVGEIDFVELNGHVCRYLQVKEYPQWKDQNWYQMKLPIVPERFDVVPIEHPFKQKKYAGVKNALKSKKYDGIIVGTDADTEGNGIYYLLCESLHLNKYKTLRFFEESLTEREIVKSLCSMTDFYTNPRDVHMTESYRLRSRFDWLLGMNSTISVSRKAGVLFKVGRVKAQTMNIVYQNSEACDNFKPHSDYEIHAIYKDGFKGILTEDGKPVSFEKPEEAQNYINSNLNGINTITVKEVERKRVKTYPPQVYKLSSLQVDAGTQLNITPQEVLETVQKLYEKGYVSYPRTDGEHISSEKAKELPYLVRAARKVPELEVYIKDFTKEDLDRALKNKKFVNDEAVKKASHDALLPTNANFNFEELPEIEKSIYTMICKRLIAQFLPELEEEKTSLDAVADSYLFHSTGSVVVEPGWTKLYPKQTKADIIPAEIKKGTDLQVETFEVHEKKASPPKRLTVATLIAAMEGIAKYISDKLLKKAFTEAKGIGTPATRGAIITELIDSGYVESKGKTNLLYITEKGRNYIKALGDLSILNPEQAAEWETYFQEVKVGNISLKEAEEHCFGYVNLLVAEVGDPEPGQSAKPRMETLPGLYCPYCNKPIGQDKFNFKCTNTEKCTFRVSKENGKVKEKHIEQLIKKKKTSVIKGLVHSEKNNQNYDAALVLMPKGSKYSTNYEFPKTKGKK